MRFREEIELLGASGKALAGYSTRTYGYQALENLVARAILVCSRIEKGKNAVPSIGDLVNEKIKGWNGQQSQTYIEAILKTSQKEKKGGYQCQAHRSPEVGFHQHQYKNRRNCHCVKQKATVRLFDLSSLAHQEISRDEYHNELCQFGRLEVDRSQVDPAMGTIDSGP